MDPCILGHRKSTSTLFQGLHDHCTLHFVVHGIENTSYSILGKKTMGSTTTLSCHHMWFKKQYATCCVGLRTKDNNHIVQWLYDITYKHWHTHDTSFDYMALWDLLVQRWPPLIEGPSHLKLNWVSSRPYEHMCIAYSFKWINHIDLS